METTLVILLGVLGAFIAVIVRIYFSDADLSTLRALHLLPADAYKNKVCVITGASSGIGEAMAYEIAKRKGIVVLCARRLDRLVDVAAKCKNLGSPDALAIQLDLEAPKTHKTVAETIVAKFKRVDYLFNNAGRSQRGLIERTPLAIDEQMMNLNFLMTISVTKAFLPFMIQQGGGHIVNTSSVAGKLGSPCSATYSATKGAINSYFDAMRMEMSDRNITVTNVMPGPVRSEITQHAFVEEVGKELGHPQEDAIKRVSAERCAELMIAGAYFGNTEVWISPQPILLFMYFGQYCPTLAHKLGASVGRKRVAAFRSGQTGYDSIQSPASIFCGRKKQAPANSTGDAAGAVGADGAAAGSASTTAEPAPGPAGGKRPKAM